MTAPALRLAAPPAASAARCRWCGRPAHSSLADCPAVVRAFGPDGGRYDRYCQSCGRQVVSNASRVICPECKALKAAEQAAAAKGRLRHGYECRQYERDLKVVKSREYVEGGYITAWLQALAAGALEPGMLVRRQGVLMRVHGQPGKPQSLTRVEDEDAHSNNLRSQ